MKPILYGPNTTSFNTNGLGILTDAASCEYTGVVNGQHELKMTYPTTGLHYELIGLRSIILAPTGPGGNMQPFRIYRVTKPMNGLVTYNARHILYDCAKIVCSPFAAKTLKSALSAMKSAATTDCPFTFDTDRTTQGDFLNSVPKSIWETLGGTDGSLLDVYGGEWEFDNLTATLRTRIGCDRGVYIRYGKNLSSLKQDENITNTFTGIYPYWVGSEGELVELPEKILNAEGNYGHTAIAAVDFSSDFTENAPTEGDLRTTATSYMKNNNIGTPSVSIEVKFVELSDTDEYAGIKLLEEVQLGDTVNVVFSDLGVNATARAVKVKWDCLLNKYIQIDLGSVKANLATTIAVQQQEISKKVSEEMAKRISEQLAKAFVGINGGSVRLIDTNADGNPDELYIADDPDPNLARKVWRFNYLGWAASNEGYNGPWVLGATLEDGLLATAITAANITAGYIQSEDGETFVADLGTGKLICKDVDLQGSFVSYRDIGEALPSTTTITGGKISCVETLTGSEFSVAGGSMACRKDFRFPWAVRVSYQGFSIYSSDGVILAGLAPGHDEGTGNPRFIAPDADGGEPKDYHIAWKEINGVPTLVGIT